jgi:DNA helicase-2/ATP-dependent DNA helicase PcrA
LLTAHLAKGLEFPAVFVAGMYEGGFPHFLARDKDEDIEEERRLIYVAFTRAMKRLTLSRPRRRMVPGKGHQDVEASRFLREIPPGKLRMGGSGGFAASRPGAMAEDRESRMARLGFGGAPAPAPRSPSPISLPIEAPITSGAIARPEGLRTMLPDSPAELQPGTRVWHGEFGMGVVRRMEGVPGNLKLTVLFDRSGVKSLFARYAKLEIVLGS